MLYLHLLIYVVSTVGVILLCVLAALGGSVAVISATGIPRDNSVLAPIAILIWAPLCILAVHRYSRIFAKHFAGRCPNCRTWAAHLMFTHPISFRCSTCGEWTKTNVHFPSINEDCPSCGEHQSFRWTGGSIQSGSRQLLAFRCGKCTHFDYRERPPADTG